MQEILQEFISFMVTNGLPPHATNDIKGDNKRRNYRTADDRVSKKSGFYKLEIDGDFGYGYFGSYKTDEYYSFCSTSSKKYSKSEIEAFRKKADKEKIEELKKREDLYELKSKETQDFLFFLERVKSHSYLKKKKLPEGFGALHSGENLIIPMQDFDKIWNYQRIKEDGEKLYYKDAKKSGTWFAIEGETDTIYIAEGYATACTVHMATGKTVLCAFDSGNIEAAIKKVLEKYPNAILVMAADNDHETTINGKHRNTGIETAKKINAKYPQIEYRYPVFKDGTGKSDYNDLYVHEGLQEVVNQLQASAQCADPVSTSGGEILPTDATQDVPASVPANDDEWRNRLIITKSGIDQRSTINATLIVEHDDALKGIFKYDSFSKQILLMKCPPWMEEEDFTVRPIQDHDYIPLECYLESEWRLKVPKNKCADIISTVAQYKKNTFNPAKEYFDSLSWDGKKRLNTWLKNYVTDGSQSDEYLSIVGSKFICGLAARAMYPGIKFDTMIILEGEQYAGKSFLSRIMGTIHGEEYFLDDFKDIENKDALMKMQGKLVIEFPEISTMRKAEVNDLKAFITRQTDEFRPPYGRNTMVAPRQCVFIGTVNPEGAYFKDMTGNRRYWPVSCRRRLGLTELKQIMPQLHAEAAHRVKNGEQLWLTDDQYKIAQLEQNKRVISDLWIDKIEEIISIRNAITTDEILSGLGVDNSKRNNMVFGRIQQIMAHLGWKASRVRDGGKQKRGFTKIEADILDAKDYEDQEIPW